MSRLRRYLSSLTRGLLELSLVRIIPSWLYHVLGILLPLAFGFLGYFYIHGNKLVVVPVAVIAPALLLWGGKYVVESLYIRGALQRGIRLIEGKPAVFLRAYVRLAVDKFGAYGEHFTSLLTREGCQFEDGISLDEQLAIIKSCLEIALESGTTGVKIYHIWNDRVFPIDELWEKTSVWGYLNGLADSYGPGVRVQRLFVVDDERVTSLKTNQEKWTQLKQYHRVNNIRSVRCSVSAFEHKREVPSQRTSYVDATLIESESSGGTVALVVKETNGGKFVRFLSSAEELSGLLTLLTSAESEQNMFDD